MQLWLRPEDTGHLGVLFPTRLNEPKLIGIPLTNPMGWVLSPPNFSGCTETVTDTVTDMANDDLDDTVALAKAQRTSHCLDIVSKTKPTDCDLPILTAAAVMPVKAVPNTTDASNPFCKPIKYWDIYVDDFCGLVQGNKWQRRAVKQILF